MLRAGLFSLLVMGVSTAGAVASSPASRLPIVADCHDVLASGWTLSTTFIAPFGKDGSRTELTIRKIFLPPRGSTETQRLDDQTFAIEGVDASGVAYLEGGGFVNYGSDFLFPQGEIFYAYSHGPEIAFVAGNCLAPEPGVIIGN